MTNQPVFRVFDTGPLSAFANADVLGVLKILCKDTVAILLDEVGCEIRNGTHQHPRLQHVLEADWLQPRSLQSDTELRIYADVARQLVGANGRNVGETAVIAWTQANSGAIAVIDDGPARKAAHKRKLSTIGSLRLLIDAVVVQDLGIDLATQIADELIGQGGARFPFSLGEFGSWATFNGHI